MKALNLPRPRPDDSCMTTATTISSPTQSTPEMRRRFILNDAAAFRGVADALRQPTSETLLEMLAEWYVPPAWATGCVAFGDAWFLAEMVRCVRPERVVEIGVASGASSAVLLAALHHVWGEAGLTHEGRPRLESFDLMDRCYFAPSRSVGSAVPEMCPDLDHQRGWRLTTGATAVEAGRTLAGADLPLAFVDADHRHPWPVADILALRPALRPGAWIVLHDIDLPEVARRHTQCGGSEVDWGTPGVQMLFDAWPFEKIRGVGVCHNIGAVRLPVDRPLELRDLDAVLDQPWEVEPGPEVREAIDRPAAEDTQLRHAAELILARLRAGERITLFGMGNNAHALLSVMRRLGGAGELAWADDRGDVRPPRAPSMRLRRVSLVEIDPGSTVVVTPNQWGPIVARLRSRGLANVIAAREMR